MNRPLRRLLPALVVVLLLAGAAWAVRHRRPGQGRPHIVLIVWDTCRADRTQVNGYGLPTTPNLQRFAAEGTTYRQCFTPSPWTPPAHASLFTGLLPRHHGLREDLGDRVRPGRPLLAETLREAGYETVCITANPHISGVTGLDAGFDRRIPCFDSKVPGAAGQDVGQHALEWLAERSRTGGGRPFFLFLNLMESHIPYAVEDAEVAAVRGPEAVAGARAAAAAVTDEVAARHLSGIRTVDPALYPGLGAAYDGAVRIADRSTGKVLDRLRADGLLDNAVVVVCGDHGENLGEHGALGHAQSLYEPVLHVPLVIRWKGRLAAGAVELAQVRLQDLYPTLLEAAGLPVPAACGKDARTLTESPLRSRTSISEWGPSLKRIPVLAREMPDASPRFFEPMSREQVAVRDPADHPRPRKYLSLRRVSVGDGPEVVREELYDLSTDPGEDRNLLGGSPSPEDRASADRLRLLGE